MERKTSWLSEHLETFVKPHLGYIPPAKPSFTPAQMAIIKNAWRSVKCAAKGKTILLPGRDVFIFEILARRENYPTVFRPEISRSTVAYITMFDELGLTTVFGQRPDEYFIFDTGFVGSIPMLMGCKNFSLLSSSTRGGRQIFRMLSGSRSLALLIEATPKYWRRALMDGDPPKVTQTLSDEVEFSNAAALTIAIYKDSSPSFVDGHSPIGKGTSWL